MNKSPRPKNQSQQMTIRREVRVEGVGLHSGKPAAVTIKPALPNTGVVFVRKDLAQPVAIPANFEFVTQTRLATTLGRGSTSISTVEHLLSALRLLGIDNALIEVEGPEVPIMDGSAEPFCEAVISAGAFVQSVARKAAFIKKLVEVRMGDKLARIEPSRELEIRARIEWEHPAIGVQELSYSAGRSDYRELSRARTFGFLKDVEALKRMGLIQGGSHENAIVLDEASVMNPEGLRYPDEFVRHKVLDAIGDFALSPIPIIGSVTLVKAGHELHAELVQSIFSNAANYTVKSLDEITPAMDSSVSQNRTIARRSRALQGTF